MTQQDLAMILKKTKMKAPIAKVSIIKSNISKYVQSYVGIRLCIKEGKYKMLSRHYNDSKEDKMQTLMTKV